MTMPPFITLTETAIARAWDWVKGEFVAGYNAVKALIGPALQGLESTVESTLWGAAAVIVQKVQQSGITGINLGDLEGTLMNVLEEIGSEVFNAAKALGSSVLQNILLALHIGGAQAPAPVAA